MPGHASWLMACVWGILAGDIPEVKASQESWQQQLQVLELLKELTFVL